MPVGAGFCTSVPVRIRPWQIATKGAFLAAVPMSVMSVPWTGADDVIRTGAFNRVQRDPLRIGARFNEPPIRRSKKYRKFIGLRPRWTTRCLSSTCDSTWSCTMFLTRGTSMGLTSSAYGKRYRNTSGTQVNYRLRLVMSLALERRGSGVSFGFHLILRVNGS